jgi:hypothetical protein
MFASDKHKSLLRKFTHYSQKRFITLGPGVGHSTFGGFYVIDGILPRLVLGQILTLVLSQRHIFQVQKSLAVVENTKKIVQFKLEHLSGANTNVTEIQQAYKI